MKLKKLYKKIINSITPMFPMNGKTIIHFTVSGCMGEIHEFNYIGTIIGITYPEYCDGKMYYKVKILKDKNGYELRDNKDKEIIKVVPSWYLQNIGGNFYCAYD